MEAVNSETSMVSSLIELNKLTGEISFKTRVDYEELSNKVSFFDWIPFWDFFFSIPFGFLCRR